MKEMSPAARELIRGVRGLEVPTSGSRGKVRRELTASLAAGGTLLGAKAAAGAGLSGLGQSLIASLGVAKTVLVIAAVVAASGAAAGVAYHRSTALRRAPKAPDALARKSAMASASGTALASPTPPATSSDSPNAQHVSAVTPKLVLGRHEARSAHDAKSISAELTRLQAANEALESGDPRTALALLAGPEGSLRAEYVATRVLALCKAGDIAAGRALRAQFLETYQDTPLAQRVRDACSIGIRP